MLSLFAVARSSKSSVMTRVTHSSRHGGDLVVAERDDDEVLGFGHVLRNFGKAVVAEVQGHQLLHLEQVRWKT